MNRSSLVATLCVMFSVALVLSACQRMGAGGSRATAGTVHVLFSKLNSEKYGYSSSERIEDQLKTAGFNVHSISDADLAALKGVTPDDVVVMCGVYLMDDGTVAALTKFARAGGGVLWIDAPIDTIPGSAALRDLLGCSAFTVSWNANFTDPGTPRPILYKHFINGGHNFFLSHRCYGNSAWAVSSAYEFGRFPPITNSEWDVVDRSPVKRTGIIDRIPVWTLNMQGRGRVVLFNWKAQAYGGSEALDMIRRATAWLLADGDETVAGAILAGRHRNPDRTSLDRLPAIETVGQPMEEAPGNPKDFRMPMGIFVRPQNYGQARGGQVSPEPLRDWPLFKKLVANVKLIGSNMVVVSAGAGSFTGPRNLLEEFIDAMHEQGIAVTSYSGDPGPGGPRATLAADAGVVGNRPGVTRERATLPIGRDVSSRNRATTHTQAAAETRPANQQVGCIWEFIPKWAEFLNNLADNDLDGMCVPPDEYRRPVYNGKPSDDNECTRRFKQQYGYDMPAELGDNPQSRAWLNYEYDSQATAYAMWNNLVLKKKPNIVRTNILFMGELQYNKRNPTNWGKIGHATDWSYLMSDPYMDTHMELTNHWYVPEAVKRLTAATKNRRAMVTLENNRLREFNEQIRPLHVYGQTVSSIAHGSCGVLFFHYFKIFDDDGNPYYGRFERTIQANSLLRTLDKWGVLEGRVPQQVVLLFGHMGQDYVALKRDHNLGSGYDSQQAAIEMLLANGYPFDIYELDHEDDWTRLSNDTKAIVVPYAYAISDKAVAQLEAHARAGKKIIIMQRLGEADMKGDPRPVPALTRLLAEYPRNVIRIDGDIAMGRLTPDYEAQYCQAIDAALGADKQVYLDRRGQDIEATTLDLPGGKKILFAINWERQPARFGLGVNLPDGTYRLTERNLKGTQPASIKGRAVLSARDLRRFRVDLATEELKIWLIEPAA